MSADWESYLRERFPGYLLPESVRARLSAAEAARFLEALTQRSNELEILLAAGLMASRSEELRAFALESLPDLVRNLPSRTDSERRQWEGGFQGRLALNETLALHQLGRRTHFVTKSRRRVFDLPENILLRSVTERLLSTLVLLRNGGALPSTGWGTGLENCEGVLRRMLLATALREVPLKRATAFDENAARSARHTAYQQAAQWAFWLRDGLDNQDPERIARVIAEHALHPTTDATRFELAVLTKLAEALEAATVSAKPHAWRMERALVLPGRKDVFAFTHANGATLRLFYNQAVLPAGVVDLALSHYLASTGRLRPDMTVTVEHAGRRTDAVVFECKHSPDSGYIARGYGEATVYRWEYADHLKGWPKAVLVTSGFVPGKVRASDDVIAADWSRWPPSALIESLVQRVEGAVDVPGTLLDPPTFPTAAVVGPWAWKDDGGMHKT